MSNGRQRIESAPSFYCALKNVVCKKAEDPFEKGQPLRSVFFAYDSEMTKKGTGDPGYFAHLKFIAESEGLIPYEAGEDDMILDAWCDNMCPHLVNSAFVVAEVSQWRKGADANRPNVYFEIGFAVRSGKSVVLVQRRGRGDVRKSFTDMAGVSILYLPDDKGKLSVDAEGRFRRVLLKVKESLLENAYFRVLGDYPIVQHYLDAVTAASRLDLVPVSTRGLHVGLCEKFFSDEVLRLLADRYEIFKNPELQEAIRRRRSNFLALISGSEYTDIMNPDSIENSLQPVLGCNLRADVQTAIKTEFLRVLEDQKNQYHVFWRQRDNAQVDEETYVKGRNLVVKYRLDRSPADDDTHAECKRLECKREENAVALDEAWHNEAGQAITDPARVIKEIRGYLRI